MKTLLTFIILLSLNAFAHNHDAKLSEAKKEETSTETILKGEKKERRKKKVEICHECGKPEEKCDCDH